MMLSLRRRHHEDNDPHDAGGARRCDSGPVHGSHGGDKRRILDEFIAATGYHEKSAIRVVNGAGLKRPQSRRRPSIYDEVVRGALIVLWEASSDRVRGKLT